jgi:hypothetical protein
MCARPVAEAGGASWTAGYCACRVDTNLAVRAALSIDAASGSRAMIAAAAAVVGVTARVCAGTSAIGEAGRAGALTGAGIEDLPIRADIGDARSAAGHGARRACTSKGSRITVAYAALTGLRTWVADTFARRESSPEPTKAEYPTYGSRPDSLECLAARGRRRECFGKYIKLRRVQLLSPPLVNMRAPSRRLGTRKSLVISSF